MKYWVKPEEMAMYDRRAINEGTPGDVLMERAGTAAAELAMRMVSMNSGPVIVFAGPGNNGGDGLVMARKLREKAYYAHVVMSAPTGKTLSHGCQANLTKFMDDGGIVLPPNKMNKLPPHPSLVVDAVLGTGFKGGIEGVFAQCLQQMGSYRCSRLAIDTPSGIDGATGEVDPMTVPADATITFAAPKAGLLLPPGCGYTGSIFASDIGISVDEVHDRMVPGIDDIREMLPERPVDGHKGTFGRLLLIGGSESMPGAPQLMALGALRSGVGLVRLAVPLSSHQLIGGRIPEVLCSFFLPGDASTIPNPADFNAVAVGPGMGNSSSTMKTVYAILNNWDVPLVLDADALNVLDRPSETLRNYRAPLLLTPHPGELSRMVECDPDSITSRRGAAERLARETGAVVVVKGRPTMVVDSDKRTCLVPVGNSGMATGGSGDVLTGILSSLLAQGMDPFNAGVVGTYVHGLAADMAIEGSSRRALIPTDIAGALGRAFGTIEEGNCNDLLTSGGRWNSDWCNKP